MERTITVIKTVSEKFAPDTVKVSITTSADAKKNADAISEAKRLGAQLHVALNAAGFGRFAALGISVSPAYENNKRTGYRASCRFSLEFDCESELIAMATDVLSECECEWRLSYAVEKIDCRARLVARAVKESQAEAQIIAAAAGETVGRLASAEYCSSSGDGGCAPVMMRAALCADAAPVEPETITLTETVTCKWEIKD